MVPPIQVCRVQSHARWFGKVDVFAESTLRLFHLDTELGANDDVGCGLRRRVGERIKSQPQQGLPSGAAGEN